MKSWSRLRGREIVVALLAAGILASGCQTVQTTAQQMVERDGDTQMLISRLKPQYEPSKLAIGHERDLMNKRAETFGIISVPEMNYYLNAIRLRLLSKAGVANVPGKVYVTANPDLEAATTPDGNIFINWSLLQYLRCEDEVAGLIAHELAHVLLGHSDSTVFGQYFQKTRSLHRVGLEIMLEGRNAANGGQQKGLKKGESSQLSNLQLAVALSTKVISPSWQRGQERSADLLGVDLMVAAGYNPDGMVNTLSVIKQYEANNRKGPEWEKIGNQLTGLSQGNTQLKLQSGVGLMEMAFGHKHSDTGVRIDDVKNYLDRHYDDVATSQPYQRKAWETVSRNTAFRKLLGAYDGARNANKLLENGKYNEAYQISKLTLGPARDHAYPAFVHALALDGVGRTKESDVVLKQALDNKHEASGRVYQKYASLLAKNGRHRDAWGVMNAGYERFGKAPQMVPGVVRYQRTSGDLKRAKETARMCALDYPDFAEECEREAQAS